MGIDPDTFWNLTPWLYALCVQAVSKRREEEHDHDAWIMWHGAILPKLEKFPDLEPFLSGTTKKTESNPIDEAAIMARLQAHSAKVKAENQ